MRRLIGLSLLALAVPLQAQPEQGAASAGRNAQGDVAVTIYNNNLALVQDRRQINLPAGRSRQEFPDVSAQIRPETVTRTSPLSLRYFFPQEIEALLYYNGFAILHRYGDWDRSPWMGQSQTMIYVCVKAT